MIFDKFTDRELYEIYRSAVDYEWNELLGPEPEGFGSIPKVRPAGWRGRRIKRVKRDYTETIAGMIGEILGPEKMGALRREYGDEEMKLQRLILENLPTGAPVAVEWELRTLFHQKGKDAGG